MLMKSWGKCTTMSGLISSAVMKCLSTPYFQSVYRRTNFLLAMKPFFHLHAVRLLSLMYGAHCLWSLCAKSAGVNIVEFIRCTYTDITIKKVFNVDCCMDWPCDLITIDTKRYMAIQLFLCASLYACLSIIETVSSLALFDLSFVCTLCWLLSCSVRQFAPIGMWLAWSASCPNKERM